MPPHDDVPEVSPRCEAGLGARPGEAGDELRVTSGAGAAGQHKVVPSVEVP